MAGATAATEITNGRLPGRLLRVEDLHAAVAEIGTHVYAGHNPPEKLAELVRARDGTCRLPDCRPPAPRCDLDHTIPYGEPGGHTSYDNLGALCPHPPPRQRQPRTHRLARRTLRRPQLRVDQPLGRVYTTTPNGPLAHVP